MIRAMLPFLALLLLASQGAAVAPANAAGNCPLLPKGKTLEQFVEEEVANGSVLILIRHDEKRDETTSADLSEQGQDHAETKMRAALNRIELDKRVYYAKHTNGPRVKSTAVAAFGGEIESADLGRSSDDVVNWIHAEGAEHSKEALLIVFVNSTIIDSFEKQDNYYKFACSEGLIGVLEDNTGFDCRARFFPEEADGSGPAMPNWFPSQASSCNRKADHLRGLGR